MPTLIHPVWKRGLNGKIVDIDTIEEIDPKLYYRYMASERGKPLTPLRLLLLGQVRSESLTCTFTASCCKTRLSRAKVSGFAGSSVRGRELLLVARFFYIHEPQTLVTPVVELRFAPVY